MTHPRRLRGTAHTRSPCSRLARKRENPRLRASPGAPRPPPRAAPRDGRARSRAGKRAGRADRSSARPDKYIGPQSNSLAASLVQPGFQRVLTRETLSWFAFWLLLPVHCSASQSVILPDGLHAHHYVPKYKTVTSLLETRNRQLGPKGLLSPFRKCVEFKFNCKRVMSTERMSKMEHGVWLGDCSRRTPLYPVNLVCEQSGCISSLSILGPDHRRDNFNCFALMIAWAYGQKQIVRRFVCGYQHAAVT